MNLFAFPVEMRLKIYSELLVHRRPINFSVPFGGDLSSRLCPERVDLCPTLLRAGKQVYGEAISLLYSNNCFREQLKLAEERGVKGVARVVAHRQITTIAQLREGLEFRKRYRFRNEDVHLEDSLFATVRTNTSGHKRKLSSDHASDVSGSKRRRSNSQRLRLVQKLNGDVLGSTKAKPSLYNRSEDLWENRIYSCLVVSPAGRVISDFKTVRELLEAMCDAIKAHRSLYTTGNILHCDVSSNNIIITKPETADGFKGMLIDLDLAKVRDSSPSGARHQTGTMQFMAVEVLRTADHTYRHDLESFFYVLLWMCARESWGKVQFSYGDSQPRKVVFASGKLGVSPTWRMPKRVTWRSEDFIVSWPSFRKLWIL